MEAKQTRGKGPSEHWSQALYAFSWKQFPSLKSFIFCSIETKCKNICIKSGTANITVQHHPSTFCMLNILLVNMEFLEGSNPGNFAFVIFTFISLQKWKASF